MKRSLLLAWPLLAGCPDEPPGGTGTTGTDTGPTGGTTTTTTGTATADETGPSPDMGTGEPEVPEEACVDPPPRPTPNPVPSFAETDNSEIVTVVPADISEPPLCPETVAQFGLDPDTGLPRPLQTEITRPALAGGGLPAGTFPLVAFTHGNGQDGDNYDELFAHAAQNGFIVASVINDGDVGPPGAVRAQRVLCVAEALLNDTVAWTGSGSLDGRYALTAHSTGGFGAFVAASTVVDNPDFLTGHELVSVATLAPNPITVDLGLMLGPNAPAYFVLQATGDGDTSGAAPSHYDSVIPQTSGPEVTGAERKAFVWAYDVEHSEYGGHSGGACPTTPKGVALGTTYFNGFLVATFYEDPDALDLFFATDAPTPLIPPTVANPALWTGFGGEPQVYGTSSQRVNGNAGFAARIVDGFENGDPMLSDAGLSVMPSDPMMYQEGDVAQFFDAQHLANAAFIGWEDGDEMRWELDFEMRVALAGATSLTFRIGAAVDIVNPAPVCSGVAGSLPDITLLVSDGQNPEREVDLTPYGRLALPEVRDEILCGGLGETDGCNTWELMQTTFRVPAGVMCSPDDGVFLSEIREIGLRFEGAGDLPRILLLDDLEIRSVPGEPDLPTTCRCAPTP
jgi:hypothetical protein